MAIEDDGVAGLFGGDRKSTDAGRHQLGSVCCRHGAYGRHHIGGR
ncbi:hypothetical protein [Mesorhizobium sp. J428]|nr:hypothetical protein [Mesorhizobium sp. J428]